MRVEAVLWKAYRDLCGRQKLRPSQPIEEFLRLVVDDDSALNLLRLMREAAKARVEGCEAYARVLLDWFVHDKYWIRGSGDDDVPVETLLLDSLKTVADPELRGQIEEALIASQRRRCQEKKGN